MASAAELSEPQVLAHTKQRLFPVDETSDTYAVVDTQFARDRWLDARPIDAAVRDSLAPFNHVNLGSGYPDLVGVTRPDPDLVAVERLGDEPVLLAVEAKGYGTRDRVDVERGIVQAYDRLHEANVAFAAAPADAISRSVRTLARELNVGVLAVGPDGTVEPAVTPRVVGNRTAGEADAIRFQASAQGVADRSFGLNHPKNYLAYPLAVAHDRETTGLVADRVVGATDAARTGAEFLGLVTVDPDGSELTGLGREAVRFALREHGSVDAALDAVADWKGSRERFCDLAPRWGQLTRRVVYDYPATELLVRELQTMHDEGHPDPSLVDFVSFLRETHPTFAVELFVRGTDGVRERVLAADGSLRVDALRDGNVYHSPTVFQLKTMLYHAGFLTETGTEPSNLDPEADEWALREPLDRFR